MNIVTLTSDWGNSDNFTALVKARLYSLIENVTIVDISHHVPPHNISKAAYLLKNAYSFFPKGSVHLIGVKSIASMETPHVVVFQDDHYFIGADNGIFSLMFEQAPKKVWEIDIYQETSIFTFPSRDLFPLVAKIILNGENLENIGPECSLLNTPKLMMPYLSENKENSSLSLQGNIIHIDHYHNLISNIDKQSFAQHNKKFKECVIRTKRNKTHKISTAYQDVETGEFLALFGADGMLQLAINEGAAANLLGIVVGDPVIVEWSSPK